MQPLVVVSVVLPVLQSVTRSVAVMARLSVVHWVRRLEQPSILANGIIIQNHTGIRILTMFVIMTDASMTSPLGIDSVRPDKRKKGVADPE